MRSEEILNLLEVDARAHSRLRTDKIGDALEMIAAQACDPLDAARLARLVFPELGTRLKDLIEETGDSENFADFLTKAESFAIAYFETRRRRWRRIRVPSQRLVMSFRPRRLWWRRLTRGPPPAPPDRASTRGPPHPIRGGKTAGLLRARPSAWKQSPAGRPDGWGSIR